MTEKTKYTNIVKENPMNRHNSVLYTMFIYYIQRRDVGSKLSAVNN